MNAHTVPIRAIEESRERAAASLERALASYEALVARWTEALRRTNAIVDRLLPELPAGYTHPFPSRRAVENAWAAIDRSTERKRLYRAIKPRIEAKVRARGAVEAADCVVGHD